MPLTSAGLLVYRIRNDNLEVLLAHPGGPFFQKKDEGVWTIPKGLPEKGEALEQAAVREFREETGLEVKGELISLGEVKQKGGKLVHAWAVEGDVPEGFLLKSNLFEMEWPPRSGKMSQFPEMDKAEFFSLGEAKVKINPAQITFIDRLKKLLTDYNHGIGKGTSNDNA